MLTNIHDINLKPLTICDVNGNIHDYNTAFDQQFKISKNQISFLDYFLPGISEKINKTFKEISSNEIKIEDERFLIWVKSISEDRRLIEIKSNSELTELRYKNELLVKQTKDLQELASLGSLVSQLCHEMNTPLGISVTGLTHIQDISRITEMKFKNGSLKKSELQVFIDNLIKTLDLASSNLLRSTSILKNLRSISLNYKNLDGAWSDARTLMKQVESDYKALLATKNIKLEIKTEALKQYYLEWNALYQVISNLIRNSVNHGFSNCEDTNQIKIEFVNQGNSLFKIYYSDNGAGIPIKFHNKIFEPFFTTGSNESTGLGLPIIKDLLEDRLNGDIILNKTDIGTSFQIVIEGSACRQMK